MLLDHMWDLGRYVLSTYTPFSHLLTLHISLMAVHSLC